MMIELSPELHDAVEAAAREQGTTPEAFVIAILRKHLPPIIKGGDPDSGAQNLAEYLEGYIGIFDQRGLRARRCTVVREYGRAIHRHPGRETTAGAALSSPLSRLRERGRGRGQPGTAPERSNRIEVRGVQARSASESRNQRGVAV